MTPWSRCARRRFRTDRDARDRRDLAAALEANQAHAFQAAWEVLASPERPLAARLGLPPADARPDPIAMEDFVRDGGAAGACARLVARVAGSDVPRDAPAARRRRAPASRRCAGRGIGTR